MPASARIAVASGKGGTGKTTIATSLALSLAAATAQNGDEVRPPVLLDCDVECPNAHLFLEPAFRQHSDVTLPVPRVDLARCTACGKCAEVCEYHAIVVLGKRALVFPQLCHGCGSCSLVCPEGAVTEEPHVIGALDAGETRGGVTLAMGLLNVGEPMASPVIRQLKKWALPSDARTAIIDAPPGTSCPVVEAVRGCDYLLLVTEPTPFGLHDLRLAAQVARELRIPAGVIVNRDGIGHAPVDEFCDEAGLPVLMRIPFDREIAEGVARGRTLVDIRPEYGQGFRDVSQKIAGQTSG